MEDEQLKQLQLLTDQVKTLSLTQEAQSRTLEATIQRLNATISQFAETDARLNQVVETLDTTREALMESLNESDQGLDDLATISAGLVQATQQLKSVLPASQQNQPNSGLEGSNV